MLAYALGLGSDEIKPKPEVCFSFFLAVLFQNISQSENLV